MSKVFLIDVAKCNGCYNCQVVCKDEHCGNDWRPYAAEQPDTGQFWMRLNEKVRGQVPVVRIAYTPMFCAHCEDAPCAQVCSAGAFERREDGLLLLNPDKCLGCKDCLEACPQNAIFFNESVQIAQKCTGCAHLLDNGWEVPRCVDACAHEAILYKERAEFGELLDSAETLKGVSFFGSQVFYLNLPKRFIAGCAVDFTADEVLIGAKVSLFEEENCIAVCETDEFGDFKFDQIEPASYNLRIETEGYEPFEGLVDVRKIDVCVGDLSITRS